VTQRASALDSTLVFDKELKQLISAALWAWIDVHAEDTFVLHVWVFRKTFRLKDLHTVFAVLLGPRPAGT
jgi:hypothetical protein